jgi:periplasmic protein TonB
MAAQNDIFSAGWCNVIFENRNKDYGAYLLRKRYAKNAIIAVFLSSLSMGILTCVPGIIKYFSAAVEPLTEIIYDPPIQINILPPIEPPQIQTQKSTHKPPSNNNSIPIPTSDNLPEIENKDPERNTDDNLGPIDTTAANPDPNGPKGETVLPPDLIPVDTSPKDWAELMPEFPGGENARLKFFADRIRYPEDAVKAGTSGPVFIRFVIDQNGNISDVEIIKGIGNGCEQEAARVARLMPKWQPGKQGGRPVKVRCVMSVNFRII